MSRPVARRTLAGLAVIGAVTPVLAFGAGPAAAGTSPGGRVVAGVAPAAVTADEQCDPKVFRLINQTPPALLQLGAAAANGIATGKGVTVAVVDSGVDVKNPHLPVGTVLPGFDFTGNAGAGQVDEYGHGTAVAGEIAAQRISGSGVVGLAPAAKILPVRVYTLDGDGADAPGEVAPSVGGITLGIQAAASAGAKIINVSMSTTSADPSLEQAVEFATSRGALVVASAGNRNTAQDKSNTPRYPGAYPDVLSVAAVDATGSVTDDSIHGSYVDVAAPGVDILTAFRAAGDCEVSTDLASTSYATAYVSAVAALIAQAHPDETPAQWRYRIEATALRAQPDAREDTAGWGLIQPYEALTFVADGSAPGPVDPVAKARPTQSPEAQEVQPVAERRVDHTTRNQTLWIGLGGIVAVLGLALVALLRRDRAKPPTPRTPAGVR